MCAYLNVPEFFRIALIAKEWNQMVKRKQVWVDLCHNFLPDHPLCDEDNMKFCKRKYMERVQMKLYKDHIISMQSRCSVGLYLFEGISGICLIICTLMFLYVLCTEDFLKQIFAKSLLWVITGAILGNICFCNSSNSIKFLGLIISVCLANVIVNNLENINDSHQDIELSRVFVHIFLVQKYVGITISIFSFESFFVMKEMVVPITVYLIAGGTLCLTGNFIIYTIEPFSFIMHDSFFVIVLTHVYVFELIHATTVLYIPRIWNGSMVVLQQLYHHPMEHYKRQLLFCSLVLLPLTIFRSYHYTAKNPHLKDIAWVFTIFSYLIIPATSGLCLNRLKKSLVFHCNRYGLSQTFNLTKTLEWSFPTLLMLLMVNWIPFHSAYHTITIFLQVTVSILVKSFPLMLPFFALSFLIKTNADGMQTSGSDLILCLAYVYISIFCYSRFDM